MDEKCLCESSEVLIFSCSGSSNVGQIANQAALRLAQEVSAGTSVSQGSGAMSAG